MYISILQDEQTQMWSGNSCGNETRSTRMPFVQHQVASFTKVKIITSSGFNFLNKLKDSNEAFFLTIKSSSTIYKLLTFTSCTKHTTLHIVIDCSLPLWHYSSV